MFPSPWIFTNLMDVIAVLLCQSAISLFPYLEDKWFDLQLTNISHNLLPSNGTKSRFHTKSKEVRFDTSTEIHIYRHGISDRTKYSQGTSRPSRFSYSDYQDVSSSDSSFGTNFPFSFGQTQCSSRFPRQTSLMISANVPIICLETSHSSFRLSGSNQQYDLVLMVDGHQLFRSGNVHSSSRFQCIPLYGCQSLPMGSSSRTNEYPFMVAGWKTNPNSILIYWK